MHKWRKKEQKKYVKTFRQKIQLGATLGSAQAAIETMPMIIFLI